MSVMTESFPRQYARTQRFTVGEPRLIQVSGDGSRVVFVRSVSPRQPTNGLWVIDLPELGADNEEIVERLVVDPVVLLAGADDQLPSEERARRERAREGGSGIVSFACDPAATVAVFALGGRLFRADLGADPAATKVAELAVDGPVFDPRPSPDATAIAYCCDGVLRVVDVDGGHDRCVAADAPGSGAAGVTWGQAEFIAAEEMGRSRGHWWAPDSRRLAVARVDVAPVAVWHIADPSQPHLPPRAVPYPAAGTANADVSLWIVDDGADVGSRADPDAGADTRAASAAAAPIAVVWDRVAFPYLVDVHWPADHPLTVAVQSRDQRRVLVLAVDEMSGTTTIVGEQSDDAWVEIVPGVPRFAVDGRLVTTIEDSGVRRLALNGLPASPRGFQVRSVVSTSPRVIYTASESGDPATTFLVEGIGARPLTTVAGLHSAVVGAETIVVRSATMSDAGPATAVWRFDELLETASGGRARSPVHTIASYAEQPVVTPRVTFSITGPRSIATAVLVPDDGMAIDDRPPRSLPVLLDPYGGPHAQRVVHSQAAFLASQWLASQGFAVIVADGRGTPGRGTGWEREVHGDLAGPVLDDQVDALHALAERHPCLDLSRVAIRGWSFGGYLAALAVIRRPDVFHAAVAGAPVTDWRLYDTHYTERYLGDPFIDDGPYERSSLLADAARLSRPLMLVHGLADDNVVVAHTLKLSQALLEAGRPHTVLPLAGVSHMTPQEVVAENLLLLQVAFLRDALGNG